MLYRLRNGFEISSEELDAWNERLEGLDSVSIVKDVLHKIPQTGQTSALGLSGLVILDMLERQEIHLPLVFIDTLHHFPQTLELLEKVDDKYQLRSTKRLHIFKPAHCATEAMFAQKYGDFLWQSDEDRYDYLVKAEPARRAYEDLALSAVITGRRRAQGAARSALPIIEVDELNGILKVNPLHNWSFDQVKDYIDSHDVPYNELLDLGYRSVGDYHSTEPVKEGEDERAGRWRGKTKTECGIHETSRFAKYLQGSSV